MSKQGNSNPNERVQSPIQVSVQKLFRKQTNIRCSQPIYFLYNNGY
jgi:hypothetical protein